MTQKQRTWLSRILIIAGIFILLAVLINEAVGYPWKSLFARWGWVESETVETLPDPEPLPQDLIIPEPSEEEEAEDALLTLESDEPDALPDVGLYQLGTIKIPSISLSENVVEGTGNEMYYAVGHLKSSAAIGAEGNCVLAAHRNLVRAHAFRHIDKLTEGDLIYLDDGTHTYVYEVYSSLTVNPEEVWVTELQEGETHMLTLISCTPALSPTHRLIVWARLVELA